MKKLIEKVLTDESVHNTGALSALFVATDSAGYPWYG